MPYMKSMVFTQFHSGLIAVVCVTQNIVYICGRNKEKKHTAAMLRQLRSRFFAHISSHLSYKNGLSSI